MKRLLLTGALVALVSFGATAAHADDAMNARVLKIIVTGLTKANHKPHRLLTVWLPYETRSTCESAEQRLDLSFIQKAVQAKRKDAVVWTAAAACVEAGSLI